MAENRSMAALCGSQKPDVWIVARGLTSETPHLTPLFLKKR